jgi:ABC-type Zn uptake system ZnuABC Zn-binding protein ZnuA
MNRRNKNIRLLGPAFALILVLVILVGCGPTGGGPATTAPAAPTAPLLAVTLEPGTKLRAVATTTIVGDVVRQVGGDRVEVSTLLPPGADPHSYQARPDDLRKLDGAQIVFVNGLHLEEAMQPTLDSVRGTVPVVAVNAGVPTIEFGGHEDEHETAGVQEGGAPDEHDHGGADPHTWMDVGNVVRWVDAIATALGELDPAGTTTYEQNATAYKQELTALDDEIRAALAGIPPERRKLVTDHDNLSYLARAYGLEVIGAVIPAISTMAAASAQERAALQRQIQEQDVPAILVDATVNADVALQLAADTGVPVVTVYTGSLSATDGPAPTYVEMMRHAVSEIVQALQ